MSSAKVDRGADTEKARAADLLALLPRDRADTILDVGARDGWFSLMFTDRFRKVTALDLEQPEIDHPQVECVKGNATKLAFGNDSFDLVFCAEVLEHIPSAQLAQVCAELQRVASKYIVIGVPYRQDTRVGQTRCRACGALNPPWGHVNSFDEEKLKRLFSSCEVRKTSFVGENSDCTNAAAVFLMDVAGNPYGTYHQQEPCIHCGAKLEPPGRRSVVQRIATKVATGLNEVQKSIRGSQPNWIHVLFEKVQSLTGSPAPAAGHDAARQPRPAGRSKTMASGMSARMDFD